MDYAGLTGAVICEAYARLIDTIDGPCVVMTHSMSGPFGWKLAEMRGDKVAAVIGVAPGPPGNIQPVPEILERGDGYVDVLRGAFRRRIDLLAPRPFENDIVEQKLVGGGDRFPRGAMDRYKRSLTATPPRVAYERSNIEGSQLRIENAAALKGKPALVVCADHDPDHTRESDGPIIGWLNDIGADAEFCWLPDRGISGNGHMMMLETNNADIAALIADWIAAKI
jgi:pimeloyl-ACP methyl ester carboxylesterase